MKLEKKTQATRDFLSPTISIVSINYNNAAGLQKTIESVRQQTYASIEYIVIDGGSNDGSRDLIEKCGEFIDYSVSERDDGIADAFNKGVRASHGDYLLFLNSGDTFANPNTLTNCLLAIGSDQCDLIVGQVLLASKGNQPPKIAGRKIQLTEQLRRNYLPHQAMLIGRHLFDQYGLYRSDLKLGMDYEWSLRLVPHLNKIKIEFVDQPLSNMEAGGVSSEHFGKTFMTYHRVRQEHKLLNPITSLLYSYFFIGRRAIGNFLRKLKRRSS